MRVETAPRCACAPPLDCSEGLAYYRQKSAVQLADIYLKNTHRPFGPFPNKWTEK